MKKITSKQKVNMKFTCIFFNGGGSRMIYHYFMIFVSADSYFLLQLKHTKKKKNASFEKQNKTLTPHALLSLRTRAPQSDQSGRSKFSRDVTPRGRKQVEERGKKDAQERNVWIIQENGRGFKKLRCQSRRALDDLDHIV